MSTPIVTAADIEARIVRQEFFTAAAGVLGAAIMEDVKARRAAGGQSGAGSTEVPERLHQVTLCVLTLDNGHVSVGVNYGPVDPAGFDEFVARRMARQNAFDQLWPMFGFALRESLRVPAAASVHPVLDAIGRLNPGA